MLLDRNQILYFLHIPRTAGTTLAAWLSRQFEPREVCPTNLAHVVEAMDREELGSYRFFAGHLEMRLLEILGRLPRVITWMRDPAERLFSSYHYLRSISDPQRMEIVSPHALMQWELAHTLSFEDWLHAPPEEIGHLDHVAKLLAEPDSWGDGILQDALTALSLFDHIGLVERMQDSLDLLCYRFGWLPYLLKQRLNRSAAGEVAMTDSERRMAEQLNPMDGAVYREASIRFECAWQAMLGELQRSGGPIVEGNCGVTPDQRAALHRAIATHVRRLRAREGSRSSGTFKLGNRMLTRGFRPSVQCGNGSQPTWVRWLGPEPEGEVFLPLPRGQRLWLRFDILELMSAEILAGLEVHVNGHRVYLEVQPQPREGFPFAHRFTGEVSLVALQAEEGLARVHFRIPRCYPEPVASDPAQGPLDLGFSISEIEFPSGSSIGLADPA